MPDLTIEFHYWSRKIWIPRICQHLYGRASDVYKSRTFATIGGAEAAEVRAEKRAKPATTADLILGQATEFLKDRRSQRYWVGQKQVRKLKAGTNGAL